MPDLLNNWTVERSFKWYALPDNELIIKLTKNVTAHITQQIRIYFGAFTCGFIDVELQRTHRIDWKSDRYLTWLEILMMGEIWLARAVYYWDRFFFPYIGSISLNLEPIKVAPFGRSIDADVFYIPHWGRRVKLITMKCDHYIYLCTIYISSSPRSVFCSIFLGSLQTCSSTVARPFYLFFYSNPCFLLSLKKS